MSIDFPNPHYRYYLVELDSDRIPINLWDAGAHTLGSDSKSDIIQRAQELVINKSHRHRYGLAIIEILDVITPIIDVTVHHKPPKPPELPEVWNEPPAELDGEEQ